jgi:DNA repair protein RecO (recombination protein O)
MRVRRVQAIVLRRTNYGEADRIVQLLTPEGKKSVIARGVRREKSRLAGGIELFAVSDVVIGAGKGDLGVLTSARLIRFYRHILEDYDTMQFGYEAVRLVTRACEAVDEPEWYDILEATFAALDTKVPNMLVQTWFYLRHAALLGGELSLTHDTAGSPLSSDSRYAYDIGEKGLRVDTNGTVTANHIKYLRLLNAKPLQAVAQIGGIEAILPECWQVARQHAAL